jgi:Rrf2 family protein
MLMLSKKVEYALMALLHVDGLDGEQVVSSKELAETYDLPVDLMGKVLQSLARHGFVEAHHGAKGGYRAVRVMSNISLGEVIQAIEGPVHLVKCQHDGDCVQLPHCSVRDPILKIHSRLQSFIHGISLAELKVDNTVVAGVK